MPGGSACSQVMPAARRAELRRDRGPARTGARPRGRSGGYLDSGPGWLGLGPAPGAGRQRSPGAGSDRAGRAAPQPGPRCRSWQSLARLAGPSSREFLDGQALPTETAVRPFLVALAWRLAGFSDFQHLGMFNRLHLAQLVFGAEAVDTASGEATEVLD